MTNDSHSDIRKHFPAIKHWEKNNIVYLDNAATTQKPSVVLNKLSIYYAELNANVHRGHHSLSEKSTTLYESARDTVKTFINAKHTHEIIWTAGTTDSINLVATSYVAHQLAENDIILISSLEHHANLVPWQQLCKEKKAILKVIPLSSSGELAIDAIDELLSDQVKFLAITHVSNALGFISPIKTIIQKAKAYQIPTLIDGAQAIAHIPIDVQELDCDFYAFSAHKLFAPTGLGVLYVKEKQYEKMYPSRFGGEMIKNVTFDESIWAEPPAKFEPGTPNIAGVIGLGAACEFLLQYDRDQLYLAEKKRTQQLINELKQLDLLHLYTSTDQLNIVSFTIPDLHPQDIGMLLNQHNIQLRIGHHCAMPLMQTLNIPGTIRVSTSLYTNDWDIDRLIDALTKSIRLLTG